MGNNNKFNQKKYFSMKYLMLACFFFFNSIYSIICQTWPPDRDSTKTNTYNISLFKDYNELDFKSKLENKFFKLAEISLSDFPFRIFVSSDSIFEPSHSFLIVVYGDSSFSVTRVDYKKKDSFYTADFDYQDSFVRFQFLFLLNIEISPKYLYYKVNVIKSISGFRAGTIAPNVKLISLDKSEIDLHSLFGNIIIVNWWSPWCKPCIEEIPFLNDLYEKYKFYDDVKFLAITHESSDIIHQKYDLLFPHYTTNNFLFGNSFPRNMIIDKKGIIIFDHIGASSDVIKSIDSIIQLSVIDGTN